MMREIIFGGRQTSPLTYLTINSIAHQAISHSQPRVAIPIAEK
jgi:hypothetical protein